MSLQFTPPPDFSLDSVIHSHGWIQLPPFKKLDDQIGFEYVDQLPGGSVYRYSVYEREREIFVNVDGDIPGDLLTTIQDRIQWMLALNQDLSEFYAAASREPKLAHVIEQRKGRLLRSATIFEDVVKTILTTNTTWSGTIRMVKALVEELGTPYGGDPSRRAFPTASQIARGDEKLLRDHIKLGYRAPYILELARAEHEGKIDLEALKKTKMSSPDLEKQLLGIKGVGRYAAAHLMMFLERYDSIPVDSWAVKMVSREWYNGEPVKPAQVNDAFQQWGKWKGLAFWFWKWDPEK